MKLRLLAVALAVALSGCAYDPYGPDVAGSVAVGSGGVYGGSVSVGTGVYSSPGYYGTSLLFPVLPPLLSWHRLRRVRITSHRRPLRTDRLPPVLFPLATGRLPV